MRTTVDWLADRGILAAPGDFYGTASTEHVRIALTATDERIAAAAGALGFYIQTSRYAEDLGYVWAADGAIDGMPASIVVTKSGEVVVGGPKALTVSQRNRVKQSYSAQIVKSQAARFGWRITETKPNVFQVVKR